MLEHPVENSLRPLRLSGEWVGQDDDCLTETVDVDREDPVIIVFGSPIGQEEMIYVIPKSEIVLMLTIRPIPFTDEVLKGLKIEARVERIHIAHRVHLPIVPGAIVALIVKSIS